MDNLDRLTDSELRHHLIKYGFPNVPVTSTTRKILIKKFRNHLNNEQAKLSKETALATRYSSDEEAEYVPIKQSIKPSIIPNFLSTIGCSQNTNGNNVNLMPPPLISPPRRRHVTGNCSSRYEDPSQESLPSSSTNYIPPLVSVESDDSDYYDNSTSDNGSNSSQEKNVSPQYRYNLSPKAAFSKLRSKLKIQYGFKKSAISCASVAMVIGFFGILSYMYLRLCNQLQMLFLLIGSLGIGLIAAAALYLVYKLIVNYRKFKQDKINYFTDEIINHLMLKAAQEPKNASIVVNHLRDKLIPLPNRKSMEYSWNEAIKYLENNESRIQFEVDVLNAENSKLLKWNDTVATEQILQQKQEQHYNNEPHQKLSIRKWQNPIFEKANKIAHAPSPCLKIYQMFSQLEANDPNLKIQIQDAILKKVGSNCKIYEIHLDHQNCCVYLRCGSEKDAAIVNNEINGWSFGKSLISIKFIRMGTYLKRYPKSSPNTGLHMSNKKNL